MVRIYVHVALFVDGGRRPFDESIVDDVSAFVNTVMAYKRLGCIHVCVLSDHIHLLLEVPPGVDVMAALETLRFWLPEYVERHTSQPQFAWHDRMWVVSKSPGDLPFMVKYFRKQGAYHEQYDIQREWEDMLDLEEIVLIPTISI